MTTTSRQRTSSPAHASPQPIYFLLDTSVRPEVLHLSLVPPSLQYGALCGLTVSPDWMQRIGEASASAHAATHCADCWLRAAAAKALPHQLKAQTSKP